MTRIERNGSGSTVAVVSTAEFLVAFALAGAAGTAVFFHAERNRIGHPSFWAGFVFLFLVVGLPVYVLRVRRIRKRRQG